MAVVINLDPFGRFGQFEQIGHLLQKLALRSALGQPPVQRLFRIAGGLRDQTHTVATLGNRNFNLALGPFRQRLCQQIGLSQFSVEQDETCGRHIFVKLREEAGEHFVFAKLRNMRRKKGAVPPILSAANEEGLNAHDAVAVGERKNIGIADALRVDRLTTLDEGQRLEPVAQHGGTFEVQPFRSGLHLGGKLRLHTGGFAIEEGFGVGDKIGIGAIVNPAYAWRGASLDLVQQARPVTVVEKTVRTTA